METFNSICISIILGSAALGLLSVFLIATSWGVITLIDYYQYCKLVNKKAEEKK